MPADPDFDFINSWLRVLNIAKEIYPAIIVILFIVSFIAHGITTAPDNGDKVKIEPMRGPGGRPLPIRRKSANQIKEAAAVKDLPPGIKSVFKIGQVAIVLSFVVNAAIILFETVLNRKDQWWPGQGAVVCLANRIPAFSHQTYWDRYTLQPPPASG